MEIASDDSIKVEPVVDRDTLDVAGSPDIGATILAKIAAADVAIADVTIINQGSRGRLTPNPNVMVEVGYTLAVPTIRTKREFEERLMRDIERWRGGAAVAADAAG